MYIVYDNNDDDDDDDLQCHVCGYVGIEEEEPAIL